jgi:hypothetical protein
MIVVLTDHTVLEQQVCDNCGQLHKPMIEISTDKKDVVLVLGKKCAQQVAAKILHESWGL